MKQPHSTVWWDISNPLDHKLVRGVCYCYVDYDHWKVGNVRTGQWVPEEARR